MVLLKFPDLLIMTGMFLMLVGAICFFIYPKFWRRIAATMLVIGSLPFVTSWIVGQCFFKTDARRILAAAGVEAGNTMSVIDAQLVGERDWPYTMLHPGWAEWNFKAKLTPVDIRSTVAALHIRDAHNSVTSDEVYESLRLRRKLVADYGEDSKYQKIVFVDWKGKGLYYYNITIDTTTSIVSCYTVRHPLLVKVL